MEITLLRVYGQIVDMFDQDTCNKKRNIAKNAKSQVSLAACQVFLAFFFFFFFFVHFCGVREGADTRGGKSAYNRMNTTDGVMMRA